MFHNLYFDSTDGFHFLELVKDLHMTQLIKSFKNCLYNFVVKQIAKKISADSF